MSEPHTGGPRLSYHDLLNIEQWWEHEYHWLIDFIEMCSCVERCDLVIRGLEDAMAACATNWRITINETTLDYHPASATVIAVFMNYDSENESTASFYFPSQMDASAFLAALTERRELLRPD